MKNKVICLFPGLEGTFLDKMGVRVINRKDYVDEDSFLEDMKASIDEDIVEYIITTADLENRIVLQEAGVRYASVYPFKNRKVEIVKILRKNKNKDNLDALTKMTANWHEELISIANDTYPIAKIRLNKGEMISDIF